MFALGWDLTSDPAFRKAGALSSKLTGLKLKNCSFFYLSFRLPTTTTTMPNISLLGQTFIFGNGTYGNASGNGTKDDILEDIHLDSNFAYLMFSLILAMTWVLYIMYYNSRVVGYIITRLLMRFVVKKGYLSIGSFTVCAVSGKLVFFFFLGNNLILIFFFIILK